MKEKLKQAFLDFDKDPRTSRNTSAYALIKAIVDAVCNEEMENDKEEWLTADQFAIKYPILNSGELHRFYRFSKDFESCCKTKNRFRFFNPKMVFEYIVENKSRHPKIYNRLKQMNILTR